MTHPWPADRRARAVIAAAHRVHLGVATRSGPHVSPTAVAIGGGKLWIVTPRGSLRVRTLKRRPEVGAVLRAGERSVVLRGTAEILDPTSPTAALRLLRSLPAAKAAALDYLPRNRRLLGGYTRDLLDMPAGALPVDRVMLVVRPLGGLLVEGDEVLTSWGEWPVEITLPAPRPSSRRGSPAAVRELPPAAAALCDRDGDAVLGWSTAAGPLALPASWRAAGSRISIPAALVDELDPPRRAAACLSLDDSTSSRPSRLRGLILRGPGELRARRNGWTEVSLRTERLSWFTGFTAGTVEAPAARARRPA